MKKIFLLAAAAVMVCPASANAHAGHAEESDTLKVEKLMDVTVSGVRLQRNAPYAVTNISKQALNTFSTSGQELPFLFARTPGVLAWSENGLGTGTTYMRIRGSGDSRINVTLDGVPLNSPEDQCVFWANMNSYGSLLGSVQIQRGVGTSTNGDGAFGGTVALSSAIPSPVPGIEVSASYGSYNTYNVGGKFSSGLLGRHFVIDGAYHETNTDGFIHGTSGHSGSFYGGVSYVNRDLVIRYKNFGNFEHTGQAWNGVTAGSNDLSLMDGTYGSATGIKEYKDLYDCGLGKFNSLYEYLVTDADGNFVRDANGEVWLVPRNRAFRPIHVREGMEFCIRARVLKVLQDTLSAPFGEIQAIISEAMKQERQEMEQRGKGRPKAKELESLFADKCSTEQREKLVEVLQSHKGKELMLLLNMAYSVGWLLEMPSYVVIKKLNKDIGAKSNYYDYRFVKMSEEEIAWAKLVLAI